MARNLLQYNIPKKKYRLSKTFKKRLQAANKRLQKFEEKGLKSNEVQMFKDLIAAFNAKSGQERTGEFDINKWYTKEQQAELRKLVNKIYEEPKTSVNYWKKFYKDVKEGSTKKLEDLQGQFDFRSEKELIEFVDNMERFKQAALMQTVLSSEQYEQLHLKAGRAGFKDLDKRLAEIYTKTGATKENLYNLMFDVITNYQKQQKAQEEAVKNMF